MRLVRGFAWLAALGAPAIPAAAAGATPQILAHGGAEPVGGALVRTSAAGDLLVTWTDGHRVRTSFRLDGRPFSAAHTVPGLHVEAMNVASIRPLITTTGHGAVAWPTADGKAALIATAPRGGPFAVPQMAPGSVSFRSSGLAFSPDGHGAILSAPAPGYAVALGQPDGGWGAPERVTTERVSSIRVAVGDGGGVLLAWTALAPCGPPVPHTFVAQCQFVRAVVRPPGGVFGPPIILDSGQVSLGPPRPMVDAAGRLAVLWRHSLRQANATMLARGTFAGGFAPAVALPGTDRPTADACPPGNGEGVAPEPRVVAVRPRPDGGAFVLVDRDEGCGPLLSEVPMALDGTAGTPVRLTAAPLAPKLGFDLIGLGGRTPAIVTRTAAGAVAAARTAPEAPFAAPIAVTLPAHARRGPTTVLRDGRVVVAFSRPCRPGAHVAEAVVLAPGGSASKPTRLSHCGDPSPVMVDRTGRAVFVARRDGDLVAWATAPIG